MTQVLAGFPHFEVRFDADGRLVAQAQAAELFAGVSSEGLTDVVMFSHGWNSDAATARALYERFFGKLRGALEGQAGPARVGTVGILWPSKRWADEEIPGVGDAGGAASLRGVDVSATALLDDLKPEFGEPEQQDALDELARLLEERPEDHEALKRFQELLRPLCSEPDATDAPEDEGEAALLSEIPEVVFGRFGAEVDTVEEGGAAGLRNPFPRLWNGAKEALRQATYWQMKKRAGRVGKDGLGPLLGRLHEAAPDLRIHLIGHSFGARLVSFALAGLPSGTVEGRPVKSLLLLQGAFSHFAFADQLPHQRSRSGALAGMAARVDGPIVVSHSEHDSAVGRFYPLASMTSGDDAADLGDLLFRWGAIGHDGAQAVSAKEVAMAAAGSDYRWSAGQFHNLDGNAVIAEGGPPAGAHSDIFHPEIAWAAASAARLVDRSPAPARPR